MCDQDHFEEDLKKYSRRDVGALAAIGIGAAMMLPRTANAAEVTESDEGIKTPEGARMGDRGRGMLRPKCFRN